MLPLQHHNYAFSTSIRPPLLYPFPPLELSSLHSPPSRIPFLPSDFAIFFPSPAWFLVGLTTSLRGAGLRGQGKAAQQKLAGFLSPLSLSLFLRFLCASLLRPTCLSSLSHPPRFQLLLVPEKGDLLVQDSICCCASLHRDLLLSWPDWLGGFLEWHGFLARGSCSS